MFNSIKLGLSSNRFLKLIGSLLLFPKCHFPIIGLLTFFCFSGFSQNTSNNNHTGQWESASSWSNSSWGGPPTGTPETTALTSVTIYGYITRTGDIEFASGTLTVNDTLVIIGNLSFKNTSDLIINNGGILIIRGNLSTKNKIDITANAYLIVTGAFTHTGSQGEINSDTIPAKVFITGMPPGMDGNVADCPGGTGYETGCNYGNTGQDLQNDPISTFFNSTCSATPTSPSVSGNNRCGTGTLTLSASGAGAGENYKWYSAATGGSLLQTNGASYTTPSISSTTNYYVSKYNTSSFCESTRIAVSAIINSFPVTSLLHHD
jgi:hypothetical protein